MWNNARDFKDEIKGVRQLIIDLMTYIPKDADVAISLKDVGEAVTFLNLLDEHIKQD